MSHLSEHYILATGGKDVKRLKLLHEVYGPGTEALLHRVGLRDCRRVVEIGCGSGNVACWAAEQIALRNPMGTVTAWMTNVKQKAVAERRCRPRPAHGNQLAARRISGLVRPPKAISISKCTACHISRSCFTVDADRDNSTQPLQAG